MDDVTAARAKSEAATQSANDYTSRGYTLADELRKAIGERFNNSPIAKDAATARGDFLAAAPQARADVLGMVNNGTILSPTQQSAIIAAKRGAALAPVMGTNVMQEAMFGTLEDLINAGVNSYNALTASKQGAAQLARQSYTDLLNEVIQKANLKNKEQEMANQQEQLGWERQMQPFKLEQLKAQIAATNRSNAGSSAASKWGDNEITRAAGVVGQTITPENSEKVAYQQYLANQTSEKAATGALVDKMDKQGYWYDPIKKDFIPKPSWIDQIRAKIGL